MIDTRDKRIKIFSFLVVLILITLIRSIPLIKYQLPIGWDAPAYVDWIKDFDYRRSGLEPFLLFVFKPFSFVGGEFISIKVVQFISFFLLTIGTFILVKRYLGFQVGLISLIIVALMPGVIRPWVDQYRMSFGLGLLPIFLLSFLSNERRHLILSFMLLILLSFIHRLISLYILSFLGTFFLLKLLKISHISLLKILSTGSVCLISSFIYSIFWLDIGAESSYIFKFEEVFSVIRWIDVTGFLILPAFAGFVLIFHTIFKGERVKEYELAILNIFLVTFLFALGILGSPFLIFDRFTQSLAYPTLLMACIFFSRLFQEYPLRGSKGIVSITFFLFLIPSIWWGSAIIFKLQPLITDDEITALNWMHENVKQEDLVLVISRLHYWAEVFLNRTIDKDLLVAEWYCLTGKFSREDPRCGDQDIIFNGNIQETRESIINLSKSYNASKLWAIYTEAFDPVNSQLIKMKCQEKMFSCRQQGGGTYIIEINLTKI